MDKSDINEKSNTILREAEKELLQALQRHYEAVKETLEMEVELIQDNPKMHSEERAAAQEWAEHVTTCRKQLQRTEGLCTRMG